MESPDLPNRCGAWSAPREIQCRLDLDYFTHHSKGVDMTWYGGEPVLGEVFSHKMVEEFGHPRAPRSEIRQRDHGTWQPPCN